MVKAPARGCSGGAMTSITSSQGASKRRRASSVGFGKCPYGRCRPATYASWVVSSLLNFLKRS